MLRPYESRNQTGALGRLPGPGHRLDGTPGGAGDLRAGLALGLVADLDVDVALGGVAGLDPVAAADVRDLDLRHLLAADDEPLARRRVAGGGGPLAGQLADGVVDLLAVEGLTLQQVAGDAVEDHAIAGEDPLGALVAGLHDA